MNRTRIKRLVFLFSNQPAGEKHSFSAENDFRGNLPVMGIGSFDPEFFIKARRRVPFPLFQNTDLGRVTVDVGEIRRGFGKKVRAGFGLQSEADRARNGEDVDDAAVEQISLKRRVLKSDLRLLACGIRQGASSCFFLFAASEMSLRQHNFPRPIQRCFAIFPRSAQYVVKTTHRRGKALEARACQTFAGSKIVEYLAIASPLRRTNELRTFWWSRFLGVEFFSFRVCDGGHAEDEFMQKGIFK